MIHKAPQSRNTSKAQAHPAARGKLELRWDRAGRVAIANQNPVNISGENAKYNWLRHIAKSDLPATSRLIAHTLCLHGRIDGSNIFPGTRVLAAESGLSERAVCTHLEQLVLHGFLWRTLKNIGRDWASTIYTLCVPKRVLD